MCVLQSRVVDLRTGEHYALKTVPFKVNNIWYFKTEVEFKTRVAKEVLLVKKLAHVRIPPSDPPSMRRELDTDHG